MSGTGEDRRIPPFQRRQVDQVVQAVGWRESTLKWTEERSNYTIPFKLSFAALGDEPCGGDVRRGTATFG